MGTKSFVDVYEQMINRHNNRVAANNIPNNVPNNDNTHILGQDEDDEQENEQDKDIKLDLGDEENKEQNKDKEQDVQDQKEDIEGDEDQDEFDLTLGDDQLNEEPKTEYDPENYGQENETSAYLSPSLAKEFADSVNQFTKHCAGIINNRTLSKDTFKEVYTKLEKIKDILKAAQKSV